ncbi:hypothetical protein [Caproicibacterium sp. BJN0003]|uniref:hypothetical protein n=1 Tax=Caproicibacterium sp. BJN0003 TaxID=2994078 RepID=UPI002256489F|nr:hypothetical protein [Caproicibacterium sp. BJN0003]UZT82915.1 hypothetical protein OP489_03655 [Caproicibacterium sp. BJN0003]
MYAWEVQKAIIRSKNSQDEIVTDEFQIDHRNLQWLILHDKLESNEKTKSFHFDGRFDNKFYVRDFFEEDEHNPAKYQLEIYFYSASESYRILITNAKITVILDPESGNPGKYAGEIQLYPATKIIKLDLNKQDGKI